MQKAHLNNGKRDVITWHRGGLDPEEGTWIWPRRPPCETQRGCEDAGLPESVIWSCGESYTLPRADAFSYSDDVTQAGWCFDLCPRAHCHGNQLFSQSVADLNVELIVLVTITEYTFNIWTKGARTL